MFFGSRHLFKGEKKALLMTPLRERLPHNYTQNYTSETKGRQESLRKEAPLDVHELAQIYREFYFCSFHMRTSFSNSKKSLLGHGGV